MRPIDMWKIEKRPFEIVKIGQKLPPNLHTQDKIFEADRYVEDRKEAYNRVKLSLERS